MKFTSYILFICSLFLITQVTAQFRKAGHINSGFVFINGEYIDAPYSIKRKGLEIYINGKLAQSYEDKFAGSNKNPFHYKVKPEIPVGLNENSDLNAFYNAKDNVKGIPILNTTGYFYLNYPYEEAIDSIAAFIESFPNVAQVKKQGINKHKITLKNGEETGFFIGITTEHNAKKWGPNGPGKMSKRKYAKTIDFHVKDIEENLLTDYLLIFTPNSAYQKVCVRQSEKLVLVDSIMHNSSLDDENKTDSLIEIINITRRHKPFKTFVKNYKTSKQFKQRIDKIVYKDKSNSKKLKNLNYKNQNDNTIKPGNIKSNKFIDIYSPDNTEIYAWCPYTWDDAFEEFGQEEIIQIKDYIIGQDYDYYESNIFIDDTPNDDDIDFSSCTYENLKNMSNAGFLYYASHGSADGYLMIQMASNSSNLSYEFNDALIEIAAIDCPENDNWNENYVCFGAFVNYEFFQEYWKQPLTESNAIVMVSACYGGTNNLIESYGGAFAMSYSEITYFSGLEYNNYHFLQRMNGKKDGGQNRRAVEAFNNIPNSYFEPCYNTNNKVTLCPATVDYTEGEVENTSVGFFEVDTWCDINVPATYALDYYVISGDVNITTEPHWVNIENGKAKRIEYAWDGHYESFEIEFEVNPDFLQSWGDSGDNEYHRLDFDRETPIEYTENFSIWRDAPSDVDFYADNTNIPEGTTVYFTNTTDIENITAYYWEFGDGTTSSEEKPWHTYNTAETYDVTLTVTTEWDSYNRIRPNYIHVFDESSGDVVCSTIESTEGTTVDFYVDFNGYNADYYTYKYDISYGDGQSEQSIDVSSTNFTHTYDDYGTYNPYVMLRIDNMYEEEVYSGGCACSQVNLIDPTPCDDLEPDFSINPNPTPLNPQTHEVTVSFVDESSGGTRPYHWRWTFLGDIYSNNEPVGGIDVETYYEAFGDNGNPDNKTYTAEGIYPVTLTVMDDNGCTDDVTKNVQVFEPDACINNLRIYSYGSDYLYSSNRLFVPLQENDQACRIGLYNNFNFWHYNINCNNCGDKWQHCKWYINGSKVKDTIKSNSEIRWEHIFATNLDIHSQDELYPGLNTISVSLEGRNYDNDNYSCYDSTSIEVIAINCDDFMHTGDFLALNNFINIPFFTSDDIYLDDYGYLSKNNNWLEFYSGDIHLNGEANNIINNNDVKLTACNGVVLEDGFETGNGNFVAQGGLEIESCEPISSKLISSDTANNKLLSINKPSLDVFPNPVNERFRIKINHPKDGYALIQLFDTQGRLIKTIMDDNKPAGCYAFEVLNFNVKPGMYFCKYTTNDISLSEKIVKT